MSITFSKELFVPDWSLFITGEEYSTDEERIASLDLERYLDMYVDSDQYDRDDPEVLIDKYTLLEFKSWSM